MLKTLRNHSISGELREPGKNHGRNPFEEERHQQLAALVKIDFRGTAYINTFVTTFDYRAISHD